MRNKQERRIFIANQQKDVYIISKIASNLNKIAFVVAIQQKSLVVFLAINNVSN